MALDVWAQGAVVALAVVQVVVLWYLFRRADLSAVADSERGDGGRADEIVCPDCGEANERRYRYCHHCVAELPGRIQGTGTGSNSERSGLS